MRRLEQLESFKHIHAPFSGILTRRNVDTGALVNAGNGGSGKELFYLAEIDPLRVYVSVPEADAPAMRSGLPAWIGVAEFPAAHFAGTVVRTANAIDQATRTLLTEVDVPNKAGRLLPGAYAQVHFRVRVGGGRLAVPSSASCSAPKVRESRWSEQETGCNCGLSSSAAILERASKSCRASGAGTG